MIDVSQSGFYIGDCRELLKQLPDACVQTCVTSPPYLWLRSYFGKDDPRRASELGLEPSPRKYVENLVDVFREVRRVLRDDGTLWLNLGDTYVANPRGPNGASTSTLTGTPDSERRRRRWQAAGGTDDPTFDKERQRAVRACGLKMKDLVGVPWRVAFAGRVVPLGAKSFDRRQLDGEGAGRGSYRDDEYLVPPTRNLRSVWTIASQPYDGAHFATMPPRLAERCVLAGSRPGDVVFDPFFGSGTTGEVAEKHGRRWIGFDLGFADLAKERTAQRSLPMGGGE